MKTILVISLFSIISICQAQQSKNHLYLEPFTRWNGVNTSLKSSKYFRNYEHTSKSNATFGMQLSFDTRSNWTVKGEILFMSHHSANDSLNIPPLEADDIWSSIEFKYFSINVPLKLGYQLKLGSQFSVVPDFGIALRFTGGHDYSETVTEPQFYEPPQPANLRRFEKFGVALTGGLSVNFLTAHNFSPFLNGSFFTGTSIFKYQRGYANSIPDSLQAGNIVDKGVLLTGGLRIRL